MFTEIKAFYSQKSIKQISQGPVAYCLLFCTQILRLFLQKTHNHNMILAIKLVSWFCQVRWDAVILICNVSVQ